MKQTTIHNLKEVARDQMKDKRFIENLSKGEINRGNKMISNMTSQKDFVKFCQWADWDTEECEVTLDNCGVKRITPEAELLLNTLNN